MSSNTIRRFQSICLCLCFLLALSACGQGATAHGASKQPAPTPKQPTPITAAQSCPSSITVQTTIPSPLPVGNHPNLIYQTTNLPSGVAPLQRGAALLQRYDTVTATTTPILNGDITDPSISPDGQWVIFVTSLQNQSAIQIMRISDQHLQTLYCAPVSTVIDYPLLSPDQNFLAFAEGGRNYAVTMNLLDLKTGILHTIASSQQPGFPSLAFQQSAATQSSLAAFSLSRNQGIDHASTRQSGSLSPLSSGPENFLVPLQWVNNNSLFVSIELPGPYESVPRLYLLRDVSKDVSQQQSNLQEIISSDDPSHRCSFFGVTLDGQDLVCNNSVALGDSTPATISIRPIAGGDFQTIYQGPPAQIRTDAVSNSTLLFSQSDFHNPDTLWKINTDGSGLVQLMALQSSQVSIWSSIVSNGSLYALTVVQAQTGADATLMFGSLSDGSPTTITEENGNFVQAVGWTQL